MSWEALFVATMIVATAGVMAVTFNPVILAIWIGCWAFALAASYESRRMRPLLFLVALLVFYPEFSDVFRGMHEKVIVLSATLVLMTVWYFRGMKAGLRGERTTRFLVFGWMTWALLAYIPVVVAWLWITVIGYPDPPAALLAIQHQTSGIKSAALLIAAPLTTLVALYSLRDCRDFRSLRRAFEVAIIVFAAVSFVEWALHRHFVPVDVSRLIEGTTRLEGFSTLDSNGLGRLLLFPTLMFVSAGMTAPGTVGRRGWIALLLAVTCIVFTQSRTTYISFSMGVAVIALLNLTKLRVWWTVGVGAAWVAGLVVWTRLGDAFTQGSERLTLTSLQLRAEIWLGVIRLLRESPWFGAHPSGYVDRMKSYGLLLWQVNSAHNMYLALGADAGIPIIVFAVAVLYFTVRHARQAVRIGRRRNHGSESKVLAVSVVATAFALAVHGISEVISPLYLFLILGCAVAARRHVASIMPRRVGEAAHRPTRRGVIAA